jgi:hypothetical protein
MAKSCAMSCKASKEPKGMKKEEKKKMAKKGKKK